MESRSLAPPQRRWHFSTTLRPAEIAELVQDVSQRVVVFAEAFPILRIASVALDSG